ncbi:hypothetical protein AMECASPLE_009670, partial [Ameca splendens]
KNSSKANQKEEENQTGFQPYRKFFQITRRERNTKGDLFLGCHPPANGFGWIAFKLDDLDHLFSFHKHLPTVCRNFGPFLLVYLVMNHFGLNCIYEQVCI